MGLFLNFLAPYAYFCLISAWGIAQNLEGLEVFKYLNDRIERVGDKSFLLMNLSPAAGVSVVSVIVTLILLIVFVTNLRASFAVSKRLGIIAVLIWIAPGLFAISGQSVAAGWLAPDVFRFTVGFPGGVGSAAINLIIALVSGWSIAILFGSRWGKNEFKNVYDHFWYPLGLAAVLYFVIDAGLPFYKVDADEAIGHEIAALNLYKKSAENISQACQDSKDIASGAARLCQFGKGLSPQIVMELDEKREIRSRMDLPAWVETLAADRDGKLKRDIDFVNAWACEQRNRPELCFKIPFAEILDSKGLEERYLFLPAAYAQAIERNDASLKKVEDRIHDIEIGHNIRYFAFLVVGFLAGGKVANATRSLLSGDVARQKSWIKRFFKFSYSIIAYALIMIYKLIKLISNKFKSN